jgi:hypothetical protein
MSAALQCGPASRNKLPIFEILRTHILELQKYEEIVKVIEVASGTGEHASYFQNESSNLLYLPTEPDNSMHNSINAWCENCSNMKTPMVFDVNDFNDDDSMFPIEYQKSNTNIIICINMIHISQFQSTHSLFHFASFMLKTGGILLTYGPYSIDNYMCESNIEFDKSLKSRNPEWGIRSIEEVENIAVTNGLILESKHEMPANNLTLIFRKV